MSMNRMFVSVALTALFFLSNCTSVRFELTDVCHCYDDLGACALNDNGLSELTVAALAEAGLPRKRSLGEFEEYARAHPKNVGVQQALVEQCIAEAQKLVKRSPEHALGLYLLAVERANPFVMNLKPEEAAFFFRLSQFATGRVVELLDRRKFIPSIHALNGRFDLSVRTADSGEKVNPYRFDSLTAADAVHINGFSEVADQLGVGAPFVGEIKPKEPKSDPYFPLGGMYQPLTAVLTFQGQKAVLTFYDALDDSTVKIGKREVPLAANFSAAWARQLDADPNKGVYLGLLRPAKTESFMGLTLTEPFRPDAIPVVFIHGLASNGATWDETVNGLLADQQMRERYQFWIYQYPSGYPFVYPAANLRRTLGEVRKYYAPNDRLPALDKIVLIGHSMGGLVSSAQVRRGDEDTWQRFFKKPINQLSTDKKTKEALRQLLFSKPEGYVRRVIFVATPHRGSTIADGWIGRLASRLIKLPSNVLSLNVTGIMQELTDTGMSVLDMASNSVTRLQYYNPVLKTLVELPFDPRVKFHTIAGDRGLGNSPDSSDGVVSYASSHLKNANSEKMVPARHSAHRHPAAIKEIRRILIEHLK
ncbi:MAG: hypothetical protein ACI8T1_000853 [Verrucomicrobiales bacterium]|jgi:hypothetical protein